MSNFLISLLIGLFIGTIDIIPMVIKKLDRLFILSAFSMWVIISIILSNLKFTGNVVVNSIFLTLTIFIPISFLVYRVDPGAIIQVIITTVILGAILGVLNRLFIM